MFFKEINNTKVIYQQVESPVFAISICLKCGSRNEKRGEYGLTHFFEHMVFKGTEKRSGLDISIEIEGLGGEIDAYTTRDNLCFTCKVPFKHYSKAMDILFDMVLNPVFKEKDIETEKDVVKEELRMAKENHEDSGDEAFMSLIFNEKELGRSVLGDEKSIDSFKRKQLLDYRKTRVTSNNLIVSGAGSVDEVAFFKEIDGYLSDLKSDGCVPSKEKQKFRFFDKKVKRDGMDGVNLYLAFETFPALNEKRFALSILNAVLGYGMSSGLFEKVREELGLAYSVSSFPVFYRNEGMLYIYASTSKGKEEHLKDVVLKECFRLGESMTEDEFIRGKNQVIGSLSLGLETVLSRAIFNTKNALVYGVPVDFSDMVNDIEKVEFSDVKELSKNILRDDNFSVLLYGNV